MNVKLQGNRGALEDNHALAQHCVRKQVDGDGALNDKGAATEPLAGRPAQVHLIDEYK